MNKPRVTIKQAVRLKAVGYDVPTNMCYLKSGETGRSERLSNHNAYGNAYSMPTLDDVCIWLRETHGLHVCIDCKLDWSKWYFTLHYKKETMWSKGMVTSDTHDAAQSAAIYECLKIIEERKSATK